MLIKRPFIILLD